MKKPKKRIPLIYHLFVGFAVLGLYGCGDNDPFNCGTGSGIIKDEAMCVGRTADSLKGSDDDYLADMDNGINRNKVYTRLRNYVPGITPEAAYKAYNRGRNNWNIWTAGNDRLWDVLSVQAAGNLDLLKTLSNHPSLEFSRGNRWKYLGLVNEPCFTKPKGPRADRYGLWLDVRSKDCKPDPFEDEKKYPGVKIGARGSNVAVGSYYGYATGIVGLRLFTNPHFDEAAEADWDAEKYYAVEEYYNSKDLIKPYRVGMSCGFCHVGPNPTNPPKDPENPTWANLNSNPGAQYFWIDRIFGWYGDMSSFPIQLFHTSRPGALDTSLVSTDYINNPRTMNAIYNLGARLAIGLKTGQEKLNGGELDNKQLNDYVISGPLTDFYKKPDTVFTPRVLKDGADSVGALGALNRVFVNIGLNSEEWLEHFRPIIGGKTISPYPIAAAEKNSSYWLATEAQTADLALFFLASARPDDLKDAPGGIAHIADRTTLVQGKQVFGERCVRCHSSKLPDKAYEFFPNQGCVNSDYLKCWNNYWTWTKTVEAKTLMKEVVNDKDFLKDNYLSTELRIPVTLLETNACSPLATNGIKDNIWDNFTSTSYKNLPAVGDYTVHHPYTGKARTYKMPGGGRGYTRPPSLTSLWSTAPFLLNNALGNFEWSGSVEDRLKSFDDSIEKLLWPAKRKGNRSIVTASGKSHPGWVDVTSETSYLRVPAGYLPDFLQPLLGPLDRYLPWLFGDGGIEIGPIPAGTPINLLSNINLEHKVKTLSLLVKIKKDLKKLPENATDEQANEVFKNLLDPLIAISKCPDYVVNRGHYFGTGFFEQERGLNDGDKKALIAFLKTL